MFPANFNMNLAVERGIPYTFPTHYILEVGGLFCRSSQGSGISQQNVYQQTRFPLQGLLKGPPT